MPTKIDVPIFKPIWNPNVAPIILITYINIPPRTEFNSNLAIFFIGTIKIFPKINITIIQAKKAIIELMSKSKSPTFFKDMFRFGQILLKI